MSIAVAPPTVPLAMDLAGTPVLTTTPVTDNVLHSFPVNRNPSTVRGSQSCSLVPRNRAGISTRRKHNLRIIYWESGRTAKRPNIAQLDSRLSHDGYLLAGAIESGGVKRAEVIDRREVGGRCSALR